MLAFAAYGSAKASPALWLLSLVLLVAAVRLLPAEARPRGWTALALAATAFGVWVVATNLWANPSYTVAAPFHAAFLIGGFLLGRRAGTRGARLLFGVALAFAVTVALWALWQWILGESRGRAVFITPATLGSATNLVLLPALVLFVLGEHRRRLLLCLIVLACALAVAQSRGAWIALVAATMVASLLVWRAGIAIDRKRLAVAFAVVACGAFASWLIGNSADATGATRPLTETVSFAHRLQLYDLALNEVAASSWLFGSGYQSFFYLLEASRPSVPAYIASSTYFVHNDYLQVLLELGAPGLALLLALVALPVGQAWRLARQPDVSPVDIRIIIALVAAISSMAVHALGDFPFYIPACVVLYGAALGMLDALSVNVRGISPVQTPRSLGGRKLHRVAIVAVGTVVAWIIAIPVAAELSAEYGLRTWQLGKGTEAAWAFETARRVDSRDWRYHWYAAQFWTAQARNHADSAAAALADKALVAGIAANPREVRPLYDRMVLHHELRRLLEAPANPATLVGWAERAVTLAPTDSVVRAGRDQVVLLYGTAAAERRQ